MTFSVSTKLSEGCLVIHFQREVVIIWDTLRWWGGKRMWSREMITGVLPLIQERTHAHAYSPKPPLI